jgi:hypothetical protein
VGLVVGRRFEPETVLVVDLPGEGPKSWRHYLVRVVRVEPQSRKKWLLGCVFARALSDEEVQTLV